MLIDVTRSINRALGGKRPTGIDRVCLAYLENFNGQCRGVVWIFGRYRLLSTRHTALLCKQLHGCGGRLRLMVSLLIHLIKDALIAPVKGDVLLHLGHSGLENEQLAPWLKKYRLNLYSMIHDLIPLTHPQFTRQGAAQLHAKRLKNMLCLSAGIIANSKFTLDCLRDYADAMALRMPAALAVHLPPANLPTPLGVAPLSTPYFVMLGTIEGRKNHALILQVWRKLISRQGNKTPKLVIIGQRGWACDNVFALLDEDPDFQDHVIELGRCDDKELSTWIAHAMSLLFPSFIEGYGIPLVEALKLGTPVIASDLPVFHEIAEDLPKYLQPNDVTGWVDAVEEFLRIDSKVRKAHVCKLKQFNLITLRDYFKKIDEFLNVNL